MLQRLTREASDWIREAVGLHDAILQRIAVPVTESPRTPDAVAAIDAARITAAATIAAAIFQRAGDTGPYDMLEDDPEGQEILDERRRREEAAVHGLDGARDGIGSLPRAIDA